jgi:phage repressor protein C with HTH and peptisase S24 domain
MVDHGESEPADPRRLEAIARLLMRHPDAPVWNDVRFVEWLAGEARADDRQRRRESDEIHAQRGDELLARVDARILGVRRWYKPTHVAPAAERAVAVVDLGIAAGVGRELWDETPESWIQLPKELPAGDYVALRIVGDSMAPLMHTGDTVLVQRHQRVQANTVIVARHPDDGYVCKRVSRITRDRIELESLSVDGPSMSIPRRADLILGTVLVVWCEHRAT